MGFTLEKDMTSLVIENAKKIINPIKNIDTHDFIYALEVAVHYRVIDIVVASYYEGYNNFEECMRIERKISKLSSNMLTILTIIALNNKITIKKLESEVVMKRDEIVNIVENLCDNGLIEKVARSYRVKAWSELIPKKIVAIELKLSNWKEALDQGIYNKEFAEYSFVVLDEERVNSVKHIIEEKYKENNVGLVYLNSNGDVKIKFVPKRNNSMNEYSNKFYKIKILKDFIMNNKWKRVP